MRYMFTMLFYMAVGAASASCGNEAAAPTPIVRIPTITISPAPVILTVGQSQTLTATLKDLDVPATSVRWTVNDTTVIRRTQTDSFSVTVTALKTGNVTLTAVPQPEQSIRASTVVTVQ